MANSCFIFLFLFMLFISLSGPGLAAAEKGSNHVEAEGSWEVLLLNSGVSAMEMALLPNNKIIILEFGPFDMSVPPVNFEEQHCWVNSAEYNIEKNTVRPLVIQRGTWCSSGTLSTEGLFVQTRGINDGEGASVRIYSPWCDDGSCHWKDWPNEGFLGKRQYGTNQFLPDRRTIIFGGWQHFNFEFLPKTGDIQKQIAYYDLEVFKETKANNLYPFVHLAPDGNLFIFANTKSILYDYVNGRILRQYPAMPGGPRNFPSSGSSVLLPLDGSKGFAGGEAEVLICGGATNGSSYWEVERGLLLPASNTCGRLRFTDPDPHWVMESMPMPRMMGDILLLPTGDVLIINGASASAPDGLPVYPVQRPLLYKTLLSTPFNSTHHADPLRSFKRFEVLKPSALPRLYASSCHVMPDGRVLVGGINRNTRYNFNVRTLKDELYPTDPILEAFSPPYLHPDNKVRRPQIKSIHSPVIGYGTGFTLHFSIGSFLDKDQLSVTILAPSFTTHSYSMNQRLLKLTITDLVYLNTTSGILGPPGYYQISIIAPPHAALAPPGHYLLFLVHGGIPSPGKWVQLSNGHSSW